MMNIRATFIAFMALFLMNSTEYQKRNTHTMHNQEPNTNSSVSLFLCGDVMTGRGLDQVMPHSADPTLYESFVKDAREYVRIAEAETGEIPDEVSYKYIWGDALEVWNNESPDFKLINLETSITNHDDPWPAKGINYRMHPKNVELLVTAGIDYCSLANNHVLDWKKEGLKETLQTLDKAGIAYSGAGKNDADAQKPAILHKSGHRVLVFSFAASTSGVPKNWDATSDEPGVNLLPNMSDHIVGKISKHISNYKQPGDIVVFSIHWGDNWGYEIPGRQKDFAHKLIDEAAVDVIHGHSSHHPRGIEVYKNKLILYGAGDFINDYEGISGHEQYRDDLTLMYFPKLDPQTGNLTSMKMVPMQIKHFRLNHVDKGDRRWLTSILNREGKDLGTYFVHENSESIIMRW